MTGVVVEYTRGSMAKHRASQATLPVAARSRGVVVAFRGRRPSSAPRIPSEPGGAHETAALYLVRLYESRDAVLNSDWNRLVALIEEAWCWRDPDCIAAIQACLVQLRRSVDQDWS